MIHIIFNFGDKCFEEEFKFNETLRDIYKKVAPETGIYKKFLFHNEELIPETDTEISHTSITPNDVIHIHPKYTSGQIVSHLEAIDIISRFPLELENIEQQTDELALAACKSNGLALEFVQRQTDALALEAVKQNGLALEFVQHQTNEICLEAVKQNGLALEFVQNRTNTLELEAVKQNGLALEFVQCRTDAMALEACRSNGLAIKYVKHQTDAMALAACQSNASKHYGSVLVYIKNQTEEMCLAACSQNDEDVSLIREKNLRYKIMRKFISGEIKICSSRRFELAVTRLIRKALKDEDDQSLSRK